MFKLKNKTKKILSIVLIVGVLLGAVAGIIALTGRDEADEGYELVKTDFDRGGLAASGKYSDTKASIYTATAFEVNDTVRVKLDFNSTVTYKVFFYDDDNTFVSASEEYAKTADVEVPEGATCARLVVTPIWDSDVKEANRVVRFWQVGKYKKQLSIMTVPATEAAAE